MSIIHFQVNQPQGSTNVLNLKAVNFGQQIFILSLDPFQKIALLTFISLSIVIGVIYQALLLKNVWKEGIFTRPINAMTGSQK